MSARAKEAAPRPRSRLDEVLAVGVARGLNAPGAPLPDPTDGSLFVKKEKLPEPNVNQTLDDLLDGGDWRRLPRLYLMERSLQKLKNARAEWKQAMMEAEKPKALKKGKSSNDDSIKFGNTDEGLQQFSEEIKRCIASEIVTLSSVALVNFEFTSVAAKQKTNREELATFLRSTSSPVTAVKDYHEAKMKKGSKSIKNLNRDVLQEAVNIMALLDKEGLVS